MENKHIKVGGGITKEITMGNDLPFTLIAGPCQLQNRDLALKIAEYMKNLTEKLGINYIFKASFDKANRNSVNGARGIGIECNLKKAQFMAPKDIKNTIAKYEANGNTNLCLTERGTSFGYGALIVDNTGLITMAETGYPVVIDATHSVQKPAAMGDSSGGEGRMAPIIARAALSTGHIAGVFIETHPEPLKGGSDIWNAIPLMYMEEVLTQLKAIDTVAKANLPRLEDWVQEGQAI